MVQHCESVFNANELYTFKWLKWQILKIKSLVCVLGQPQLGIPSGVPRPYAWVYFHALISLLLCHLHPSCPQASPRPAAHKAVCDCPAAALGLMSLPNGLSQDPRSLLALRIKRPPVPILTGTLESHSPFQYWTAWVSSAEKRRLGVSSPTPRSTCIWEESTPGSRVWPGLCHPRSIFSLQTCNWRH